LDRQVLLDEMQFLVESNISPRIGPMRSAKQVTELSEHRLGRRRVVANQ
jgi:hypothetical protein